MSEHMVTAMVSGICMVCGIRVNEPHVWMKAGKSMVTCEAHCAVCTPPVREPEFECVNEKFQGGLF